MATRILFQDEFERCVAPLIAARMAKREEGELVMLKDGPVTRAVRAFLDDPNFPDRQDRLLEIAGPRGWRVDLVESQVQFVAHFVQDMISRALTEWDSAIRELTSVIRSRGSGIGLQPILALVALELFHREWNAVDPHLCRRRSASG